MTLHNLFMPHERTWWWYHAIPNYRRGKAHLLEVPAFTIDPDRLQPPDYMTGGSRDNWLLRWQRAKILVPSWMDGNLDEITRLCHRRQQAREWQHGDDRYRLESSYCDDCRIIRDRNLDRVGLEMNNLWDTSTRRHAEGFSDLRTIHETEDWYQRIRRGIYGLD